jgi:hypothetical protein
MNKEEIIKLRETTLRELWNLLKPLAQVPDNKLQLHEDQINATKKINAILIKAYQNCHDTNQEKHKLNAKELYKQLALHLHPDKLKQLHEDIFKKLTLLDLVDHIQIQNKNCHDCIKQGLPLPEENPFVYAKGDDDAKFKDEYERLKKKYKNKFSSNGLNFLHYIFRENRKWFPFTNVNSYSNTIFKEMDRYVTPFNFFALILWETLLAILRNIGFVKRLALFIIHSTIYGYRVLGQKFLNLITAGAQKQQVDNYIAQNFQGRLSKMKRQDILKGLRRIEHSTQYFAQLEQELDHIKRLDEFSNEDYYQLCIKYYAEKLFAGDKIQGKNYLNKTIHNKIKVNTPILASLRFTFVSYGNAIGKPLSDINGNGNKLLSVVLIRPLQIISAFIIIPIIMAIECLLLAKTAIDYAVSTLLTGIYLTWLALLLMPVKFYDCIGNLIKNIKNNRNKIPSSMPGLETDPPIPSSMPDLESTNKSQADPEPRHYSSPLHAKPTKKAPEEVSKEEFTPSL